MKYFLLVSIFVFSVFHTYAANKSVGHIEAQFSDQEIVAALIKAFPDVVSSVSKSENKHYPAPALKVRDTIFYAVEGRLLPYKLYKKWAKYGVNVFYVYPKEVEDPEKRTAAEIEEMKILTEKKNMAGQLDAYSGFYETLYNISSLKDAEKALARIIFLDQEILMNRMALRALKRVEAEIRELAKTDASVSTFINSFREIGYFSWRMIAGTKRRSFHSYGVALSFFPVEMDDLTGYWFNRNKTVGDEWISESLSLRWMPPASFVRAFEKQGFTWGGKWKFFCNYNFEFRPEILILNGYDIQVGN